MLSTHTHTKHEAIHSTNAELFADYECGYAEFACEHSICCSLNETTIPPLALAFLLFERSSSSTFDDNELLPLLIDGSMCICIELMSAGAGSTAEDAGADAVCSEGTAALSGAADGKSIGNGVAIAGNTHTHTHTRSQAT